MKIWGRKIRTCVAREKGTEYILGNKEWLDLNIDGI